jgi:predicted ABC-type exoprotein transport system permease subunit
MVRVEVLVLLVNLQIMVKVQRVEMVFNFLFMHIVPILLAHLVNHQMYTVLMRVQEDQMVL